MLPLFYARFLPLPEINKALETPIFHFANNRKQMPIPEIICISLAAIQSPWISTTAAQLLLYANYKIICQGNIKKCNCELEIEKIKISYIHFKINVSILDG